MGEGREWPSGVQLFGDPLFIGVLCIGYVHTKNGASEGNGSAHLTFELICWALPYLLDSFPHPATGAKRTYRAVSRSASRQTGRRGTRCSFLFFFAKCLRTSTDQPTVRIGLWKQPVADHGWSAVRQSGATGQEGSVSAIVGGDPCQTVDAEFFRIRIRKRQWSGASGGTNAAATASTEGNYQHSVEGISQFIVTHALKVCRLRLVISKRFL